MQSLHIARRQNIAIVTMARGKVNAVSETVIVELAETFQQLAKDDSVAAVVLTGQGKFFSFGFDIPEMYEYPIERFGKFVRSFCRFYRELFLYPKPVVAAVNGHAIAGGCILALACDYRIMNQDGAKMSLNEVTFGASLFAGAVEMLRFAAGNRTAESVLLTGEMFDGSTSLKMGVVDQLAGSSEIIDLAQAKASELARHAGPAYVSLKNLLKRPVVDDWMLREESSVRQWLELWYSSSTREKTKGIQIR